MYMYIVMYGARHATLPPHLARTHTRDSDAEI